MKLHDKACQHGSQTFVYNELYESLKIWLLSGTVWYEGNIYIWTEYVCNCSFKCILWKEWVKDSHQAPL